MRRAFFVGAIVGALVFLQGLLIFRLPIRVYALHLWGLVTGGLFGLTLSSTFANRSEAERSLIFAAVGLVLFYGISGVLLRAAYRSFRRTGVLIMAVLLLTLHVGLYLLVLRSVVA